MTKVTKNISRKPQWRPWRGPIEEHNQGYQQHEKHKHKNMIKTTKDSNKKMQPSPWKTLIKKQSNQGTIRITWPKSWKALVEKCDWNLENANRRTQSRQPRALAQDHDQAHENTNIKTQPKNEENQWKNATNTPKSLIK
jgi:hypothetical protein